MAAFGYLAGVLAVVSIVSSVACLRYESAILIHKNHGDSEALFVVCVFLLAIACLVVFILNQLLKNFLIIEHVLPANLSVLSILLCTFVTAFGLVLTNWYIKHERYKTISTALAIRAAGIVVTQYLIYPAFKTTGLIYGYMAGHGIYCVMLLTGMLVFDYTTIRRNTSLRSICRVLREHKRFPLFGTWAVLLNRLAENLPHLFFVRIYSPVLAGAYSMSSRLTRAPLSLVGQPTFQVVSQRIGKHVRDREHINRVVIGVFNKMIWIAGIPFILLTFIVKPAMVLILGDSWHVAGTYCRYLVPWFFLMYLSWPLTAVYNTLNQQRMLLFFNAIFVLSVLIAFAASLLGCSSIFTVVLLSALGAVSRLCYSCWILRFLDRRNFLKTVRPAVIYSILMAMTAYYPLIFRFGGTG
jgi:O-antigen/teichoic acid export membrane protein